jgi:hypothetical protein
MNDPAIYSWQPFYLSAALETDNARMPNRIYVHWRQSNSVALA